MVPVDGQRPVRFASPPSLRPRPRGAPDLIKRDEARAYDPALRATRACARPTVASSLATASSCCSLDRSRAAERTSPVA
jgi:hypothetical protein